MLNTTNWNIMNNGKYEVTAFSFRAIDDWSYFLVNAPLINRSQSITPWQELECPKWFHRKDPDSSASHTKEPTKINATPTAWEYQTSVESGMAQSTPSPWGNILDVQEDQKNVVITTLSYIQDVFPYLMISQTCHRCSRYQQTLPTRINHTCLLSHEMVFTDTSGNNWMMFFIPLSFAWTLYQLPRKLPRSFCCRYCCFRETTFVTTSFRELPQASAKLFPYHRLVFEDRCFLEALLRLFSWQGRLERQHWQDSGATNPIQCGLGQLFREPFRFGGCHRQSMFRDMRYCKLCSGVIQCNSSIIKTCASPLQFTPCTGLDNHWWDTIYIPSAKLPREKPFRQASAARSTQRFYIIMSTRKPGKFTI